MEEERNIAGAGGNWAESDDKPPTGSSPMSAATFGAPSQQPQMQPQMQPSFEQPYAAVRHPMEQPMPPATPYPVAATPPSDPTVYGQPYPQPAYGAPQPAYAAAPAEPTQVALGNLFARTLWLIVLLGAFLMLLGTILAQVGDPGGARDAGWVLGALGSFLLGAPMVITGIYYEGFSGHVRFGLIVAGAIILGMNLI
jgi:hypothetical protein